MTNIHLKFLHFEVDFTAFEKVSFAPIFFRVRRNCVIIKLFCLNRFVKQLLIHLLMSNLFPHGNKVNESFVLSGKSKETADLFIVSYQKLIQKVDWMMLF